MLHVSYVLGLCFLLLTKNAKLQLTGVISYLEQHTEIHCHVKTGCTLIHWEFSPVGTSARTIVFANETQTVHKNFSKFIEVDTKNTSVLILRRVKASYSGTYRCLLSCLHLGGTILCEDIVELIVISENVTCSTDTVIDPVLEGETITMRCTIGYRGNWEPFMKWTQNEDDPVEKQTMQTTEIVKSNLTTTTLELIASRSMNKVSYSCSTYFIDNFVGQTNVRTKIVPKYKHKWTSSRLNVFYKPSNVKILPESDVFYVGQELTCSADANPLATFQWREVKLGMLSNASSLRIEEYLLRSSGIQLTCIAKNSFAAVTLSKNITVKKIDSSWSTKTFLLVALLPSSVLLMILLALIPYFIHLKTKGSGQNNKQVAASIMPAIAVDIPSSAPPSHASESDSYASIRSIRISHRETDEMVIDTNQQASETQSGDYTPMAARDISTPDTYKRLQRLKISKKTPAEDPATLKEIHEYANPTPSSHCYYNIK